MRWTPSFGQGSGLFKVDSDCFVMPLFSRCTHPSASCHRAGPSVADPVVVSDPLVNLVPRYESCAELLQVNALVFR